MLDAGLEQPVGASNDDQMNEYVMSTETFRCRRLSAVVPEHSLGMDHPIVSVSFLSISRLFDKRSNRTVLPFVHRTIDADGKMTVAAKRNLFETFTKDVQFGLGLTRSKSFKQEK